MRRCLISRRKNTKTRITNVFGEIAEKNKISAVSPQIFVDLLLTIGSKSGIILTVIFIWRLIYMKFMKKSNELMWLLGVVFCSLGICLTIKADFGLSMLAAPPYIIHHKLHEFHWFTHGMADWAFQAILLIVMIIIVRIFSVKYLLCFATTVICGEVLDLWVLLFGGDGPFEHMVVRIIALIVGELCTAFAIACFFRTTLPIQVHELVVTEIAERYELKESRVKYANDIFFLLLSVALAYFLNRSADGLGIGTIIITAVNAPLIHMFGSFLDKHFEYASAFPRFTRRVSI